MLKWVQIFRERSLFSEKKRSLFSKMVPVKRARFWGWKDMAPPLPKYVPTSVGSRGKFSCKLYRKSRILINWLDGEGRQRRGPDKNLSKRGKSAIISGVVKESRCRKKEGGQKSKKSRKDAFSKLT